MGPSSKFHYLSPSHPLGRTLLLIAALLLAKTAKSFPQNTRLGYIACSSCHISPSGAGALNPYGKSTGPELATFPSMVDAKETIFISGADARYLWYKSETDQGKREDRFLMQADMELGLAIGGITGVAQYGTYHHPDGDKEASYKHYLMYQTGAWTFRGGKFPVAFGVNTDDHTLPGRGLSILRQRNPAYGTEVTYGSKKWLAAATLIHGCQGAYIDQDRKTYCDGGSQGFVSHLALMPHRTIYLSLSNAGLTSSKRAEALTSVGTVFGTKHLYAIGEWVYSQVQADKPIVRTLNELSTKDSKSGWIELFASYHGLELGYTYRTYPTHIDSGIKARWIPTSGMEFVLVYLTRDQDEKTVAVSHFYL
jgi:hypothetical protein